VVVAGLARHTKRFSLAQSLGIEWTVALDAPGSLEWLKSLDDGPGPHKVIECSGAPVAAQQGLQIVRKMGWLVLVGFFFQDVGLDLDLLINKEVSVLASRGKRHSCWPLALEMMADGRVNAGALITHRFPLSAWQEAFAAAGQKGAKVVLEMD
jgi:L-iditol 2-dehydrogenase